MHTTMYPFYYTSTIYNKKNIIINYFFILIILFLSINDVSKVNSLEILNLDGENVAADMMKTETYNHNKLLRVLDYQQRINSKVPVTTDTETQEEKTNMMALVNQLQKVMKHMLIFSLQCFLQDHHWLEIRCMECTCFS